MPVSINQVARCDLCGDEIPEPRQGGGEYQGGKIEILFPAIKVTLYVCEKDQTAQAYTLQQLRESGTTSFGGTAHGVDQLAYLPVHT